MKYGAEAEKELMTEIWSLGIKDDPLNFVKFVFPWGQKDTPPRAFLRTKEVARKNFAKNYNTNTKEQRQSRTRDV